MRFFLKWLLILLAVALAGFFLFAPGIVERSMNKVVPVAAKAGPRALALHKTLAIADMHSDTLMWQRDVLDRASRGHVDLPRLEDGHVALQVFSSVSKTPKGQNYDANGSDSDNITLLTVAQLQPPRTWRSILERSLYHASKLQSAADNSGGRLRFIRTSADLAKVLADRARGLQVTGAVFSVEGLQNLEGKLANLDRLQAAGMRMAGLTHFFDNEVAGSMHGIKKGGLTPLGRQVVTELERRHIIVDIAHASHKTVADVLAMATRPVVSSHGGVQATCKVNRNLTDDEIRGVAKTGGVIGIGYWDAAVCGTEPAKVAEAIAHVRDLVGIDYVGLGSDFDGATTTGFDTSKLALVTQALMDRGFSDADIAKVMGGNVLRVLGQVLPPR
ncbi:MAG: dipeptidase [Sphingomonadaceae bacterium]